MPEKPKLHLVEGDNAYTALEPPNPPGGGNNGGMFDARLAALENFAAEARDRLARSETKLDHLLHEFGQFKWWLLGTVVVVVFTVIGTSVGIQQMTVATFQAAKAESLPVSQPPAPPVVIYLPQPPAAASASR